MIKAEMIADSISAVDGTRICSLELNYHRFFHSEFMTHRVFTRNAASSRAIPVKKMLEQVNSDPAIPIRWGMNRPGMQADEDYLEDQGCWHPAEEWVDASEDAMRHAKILLDAGIHKQIVNRLLEPWQWMKTIVTATEWDNFFHLRISPKAMPEINELAEKMFEAIKVSDPVVLEPGQWHLPYVTEEEFDALDHRSFSSTEIAAYSGAKCARVSYLNHDNKNTTIEDNLELSKILLEAQHMSPFEHQATPMPEIDINASFTWEDVATHKDRFGNLWSGNLQGWRQYRQSLDWRKA